MNPDPVAMPPAGRQAFAILAREHHRCLLVYARALSRNEATAADLVQDAFIAAALGIETSAFRKRLERARDALRHCLDRKIPNHA
jgi:DNA-directed RNA polymerase specialized sigma24 family protein